MRKIGQNVALVSRANPEFVLFVRWRLSLRFALNHMIMPRMSSCHTTCSIPYGNSQGNLQAMHSKMRTNSFSSSLMIVTWSTPNPVSSDTLPRYIITRVEALLRLLLLPRQKNVALLVAPHYWGLCWSYYYILLKSIFCPHYSAIWYIVCVVYTSWYYKSIFYHDWSYWYQYKHYSTLSGYNK